MTKAIQQRKKPSDENGLKKIRKNLKKVSVKSALMQLLPKK
jgi:hypothetical protein